MHTLTDKPSAYRQKDVDVYRIYCAAVAQANDARKELALNGHAQRSAMTCRLREQLEHAASTQ